MEIFFNGAKCLSAITYILLIDFKSFAGLSMKTGE